MHERHRSPYPSPSRSPWRSGKCPKEKRLRLTKGSIWPRVKHRVGLERPHFLPLARAKKPTGVAPPQPIGQAVNTFRWTDLSSSDQSFPVAPEGHPHSSSSSSTIEIEVKSSSPLYFSGDFTNHFTWGVAPWLGKSIRCTLQKVPSCTHTGTMGGRERPHPLTHGASRLPCGRSRPRRHFAHRALRGDVGQPLEFVRQPV